jgi:hypothetical protein
MKRSSLVLVLMVTILILAPVWAHSHGITNIVFDPPSPAEMDFNVHVGISFDYETDEASGVRIWCDGGPNVTVSPSPIFPVGSGPGTTWFMVEAGETQVTSVRMYMMDAAMTQDLFETMIEVDYHFVEHTAQEPSTWGLVKTLYSRR